MGTFVLPDPFQVGRGARRAAERAAEAIGEYGPRVSRAAQAAAIDTLLTPFVSPTEAATAEEAASAGRALLAGLTAPTGPGGEAQIGVTPRPDMATYAAQFGREHGSAAAPVLPPPVTNPAAGAGEGPAPRGQQFSDVRSGASGDQGVHTGAPVPPQTLQPGESRLKDVMANWKDKAPGAFDARTFDPIMAGRATDRGPMAGTLADLASRANAKRILDAVYGTEEDLHPSPQLEDIQAKRIGAAQEALSPIPRPLYGEGGAFAVSPEGVISNRPPGPVGTIGEARDMAKFEAELGMKERAAALPYAERQAAFRQYQVDMKAATDAARMQKESGKDINGSPISAEEVAKRLEAATARAEAEYKLRIAKVTTTIRE